MAEAALQGANKTSYVKSWVFMDVTDFLASQGNLCKSVVDYNRFGDRLYGVPVSFDLNTMVTSKRIATDREKWTKEHCMQAMEESGASVFCGAPYGWTKEEAGIYVLNLLGVGMDGIQLFVDEEKGISSFEQPEFIELLEFSKNHADQNPMDSGTEKIASGEIAYSTGSVGSFRSFWYPGPEGGQYKLIIDNFYINASSLHKEGALDFFTVFVIRRTTAENSRRISRLYGKSGFAEGIVGRSQGNDLAGTGYGNRRPKDRAPIDDRGRRKHLLGDAGKAGLLQLEQ